MWKGQLFKSGPYQVNQAIKIIDGDCRWSIQWSGSGTFYNAPGGLMGHLHISTLYKILKLFPLSKLNM